MSTITPQQLAEWQGAVGRETHEVETLSPVSLHRFSQAVGAHAGQDAPPLPHWAFFLPCPNDDAIGPDGHPRRGDFLPPITLPRRMFAAASMQFEHPLEVGAEAALVSRVAEVSHKSGRSGDLVFVEVDRRFEQHGAVCVRERQTYVYRDWGEPVAMPPIADDAPEGELWQPDEVNLFRFSAATFNGHRIHYDLPYTTEIEGYPALIVHGPFTAARLAGLAQRHGDMAKFGFRAMAPLFLGQPIFLRRASDTVFEAVRADGATAMQATVEYR